MCLKKVYAPIFRRKTAIKTGKNRMDILPMDLR